jgi:hypothetical protein
MLKGYDRCALKKVWTELTKKELIVPFWGCQDDLPIFEQIKKLLSTDSHEYLAKNFNFLI